MSTGRSNATVARAFDQARIIYGQDGNRRLPWRLEERAVPDLARSGHDRAPRQGHAYRRGPGRISRVLGYCLKMMQKKSCLIIVHS
jgi:hypothetical protein